MQQAENDAARTRYRGVRTGTLPAMPLRMMNEGSDAAIGTPNSSFKAEEERWFSSPTRGLTRRPSAPPAAEVSANLDDSVFDRWASIVPGSR